MGPIARNTPPLERASLRGQGRGAVCLTGRGGLRREVLVPRELSSRLEAQRHRDPVTMRDRGIVYQQHYNLGGGNAWSKSFGKASARAPGWSHGDHGLRRSYAQERMAGLFLGGVYVDGVDGSSPRFRWVKAPTSAELNYLTHTIAQRVGRFLERQGLLERDAENSGLSGDAVEAGPLDQLLSHSITYRIAAGLT